MITTDFKIAFPDPQELIHQIIPVEWLIIHTHIKASYIIDRLVIFRPVILNNEIFYRKDYTYFIHLN